MLIAILLDAIIGWPNALFDRIGHPVTWIGGLILRLDNRLNHDGSPEFSRRLRGLVCALAVIGLVVTIAAIVQGLLPNSPFGILLAGILSWPLIASRSLYTHVRDVAVPLEAGDMDGARQAVSKIVGRDPSQLDVSGIARAAIESLSENASDGVVAPIFWGALFGLPGLAGYKAINTLDSMIGHKTPRYMAFGWAAARIDDVANFAPARLTAALIAIGSSAPLVALSVAGREARNHRSPNAGWPEAAMAGALGVRLSGPRVYDGQLSSEPWLNTAGRPASASDIYRGLAVYLWAMALLVVLLASVALATARP